MLPAGFSAMRGRGRAAGLAAWAVGIAGPFIMSKMLARAFPAGLADWPEAFPIAVGAAAT
jgi:hypothetical protein